MSVISNLPLPPPAGPWQEVWYMKLNQPSEARALWLRFTLLRAPGIKEAAEVWAIAFDAGAPPRKTGAKTSHAFDAFSVLPQGGFQIGESAFRDTHTQGAAESRAHCIRWDLALRPAKDGAFDFVPPALRCLGIVKNTALTVFEDLRFNGWSEVDGVRQVWTEAPGMQGHLAGPKNGHSWAWAHCNRFVDESGAPTGVVVDGLSARARLGKSWASPLLSTFFFRYRERCFAINGLLESVRIRSVQEPTLWRFTARQGGYTFQGELRTELHDFAGVTYEDTDGSLLYCHNSKISSMTLDVFGEGARAERFSSDGTTAFEFVTREKHPGVHFVI